MFSNINNLSLHYAVLSSDISRDGFNSSKKSTRKYILWFDKNQSNRKSKFVLFCFLGKSTRFIRIGDKLRETIESQSSTQLQFYIERAISIQFNFSAKQQANFGKEKIF